MGLCKCPKKKVTNQFCFEHRVNVCEHCMVSNHSKCVVQSYLQWLQDSDYDPNCYFCKMKLSEGDCIRLTCYHVFHWECVNKYASCLSPQTQPTGYSCPVCNECIFPQPNAASPVVEALKTILLGVNWARNGLGVPAIENNFSDDRTLPNIQISASRSSCQPFNNSNQTIPINISEASQNHAQKVEVNNARPEPYGASYNAPYSTPRKLYDATDHGHFRSSLIDHDENKYKRRSAIEWFSRWFKSRTAQGVNKKRDQNMIYKKRMILLILCFITICTICILFFKMGRANADLDPLLDPLLNPNIRIEDHGEVRTVNAKFDSKVLEDNSLKKI